MCEIPLSSEDNDLHRDNGEVSEVRAPKLKCFTKPLPRNAVLYEQTVGCVRVQFARWTGRDGVERHAETLVGRDGKLRIKLFCTAIAGTINRAAEPPSNDAHRPGRKRGAGLELSAVSKEALRTLMRAGVEVAIQGVIDIACDDPDARNRIKACELLCRYGIGERVEVDQNVAPAIVLMIANKPEDPGWPSIASVEPLPALPGGSS